MKVIAELTKEIKPLTRAEKLQLIEAISKMLLDEENAQGHIDTTFTYPLYTPLFQEEAAAQLQQFIEQQ